MKKQVIILSALLLFVYQLNAQSVNMYEKQDFVWLGIDFTGAKMIGSTEFNNPQIIHDRYFDEWNDITVREQDKFNLKEFYIMKNQYMDLLHVKNRNKAISVEDLVTDDAEYSIDKTKVAAICSTYLGHSQKKDGLGVLYVVESFKNMPGSLKSSVYVVFMNMKTCTPIYMKKYEGIPGGMGLRSFWANSIHRIMIQSMEDYRRDRDRFLRFSKS